MGNEIDEWYDDYMTDTDYDDLKLMELYEEENSSEEIEN